VQPGQGRGLAEDLHRLEKRWRDPLPGDGGPQRTEREFRLDAQPNDWEKTVRTATNKSEATGKQVHKVASIVPAEKPGSEPSRPP